MEALGIAALATGTPEEATARFLAARTIHIDLDRPCGIAVMNRHLGQVALAAGDLTHARLMIHEALDLTDVDDDPYHHAQIVRTG